MYPWNILGTWEWYIMLEGRSSQVQLPVSLSVHLIPWICATPLLNYAFWVVSYMRGRDYSKLASLQNSVNFPGLWQLLNVGLRHTASMRILPFHSFDRNHRGWARRDFQTPVVGSTHIDRTVLTTDKY